MEFFDLNVDSRTDKGKGAARALRRNDKIPAVLYGRDMEPVLLSVNIKDIEEAFKKSDAIEVFFNLDIDGKGDKKTAMLKELQIDPVSRQYRHVDFMGISMDRKIVVRVPIGTKGRSKGVEFGGLLQIIRRELDVSCLPEDIPEKILIDVTDLDMGESIKVADVTLCENIEFIADANFTVVTCLTPKGLAKDGSEEEGEESEEVEESEAVAE